MTMATLTDQALAGDAAENADVEWLRLLVGDWQLIADLGFADLCCGCAMRLASLWPPASAAPQLAPRFTKLTSWAPVRLKTSGTGSSGPRASCASNGTGNRSGTAESPCAKKLSRSCAGDDALG